MDLILWRHAEAEDHAARGGDLERALTTEGEQQAQRMARWLVPHLPRQLRILCSPARRTRQTAAALARDYELCDALAPGAGPQQVLQAAGWPDAPHAVLLVGHQPTLGATVAQLLEVPHGEFAIRKGALWWLRARERHGEHQVTVVAVQSPGLL